MDTHAKDKYLKFAYEHGFVALGYGWIPDIRQLFSSIGKEGAIKRIKELLSEAGKGKIGRRTKEIIDFAFNINENDVIILYYERSKAYVGVVKCNNRGEVYHYIPLNSDKDYFSKYDQINRAPHRIDVEWKFIENSKPKLLQGINLTWYDTVHEVLKGDLYRIENDKVRKYLVEKMKE